MHRRLLCRLLMAIVVVPLATLTPAAPSWGSISERPNARYSLNGTVYAITSTPDRVYIGGNFTRLRSLDSGRVYKRVRLAAFDRSTGRLLGWSPSANGVVRALDTSPNGVVFVGGAFTSLNAESRPYAGAVSPGGDLTAWNPRPDAMLKDVLVDGGEVYLAGRFSRVGSASRLGLARVSSTTGALDWRFTANTTGGRPSSMVLTTDGLSLVLGGTFKAINSASRTYLGSVSTNKGQVTSWRPEPVCGGCIVMDVAIDRSGSAYAATAGRGGHAAKYSLSANGSLWTLKGDGDMQAIAYRDGVVYIGGHFGPWFSGSRRDQLAAVTASGGKLLPWNPKLGGPDHPGVWALSVAPHGVRVGGGFTSVGGRPPAHYAVFPSG